MNKKNFLNGNVKTDWKAVFKKRIDNYIICDVIMGGSKYVTVPKELRETVGKSRIKQTHGEGNAKLKLDTNNVKLMEKVKRLKRNQKIYIRVIYPRVGGYFHTDTWKVIEIFDEYDVLEMSNRNCLFSSEIPQKEKTQEILEKPKI